MLALWERVEIYETNTWEAVEGWDADAGGHGGETRCGSGRSAWRWI